MTTLRRCAGWAALLLLVLINSAAAEQRPHVIASFSILADMVAQLAGDQVLVTSLVGSDSDAHMYQPTPSDARRLAAADLWIRSRGTVSAFGGGAAVTRDSYT